MTGLLSQHAELINGSAISPEVAAERGYRSVNVKAELAELGFARNQQRVPTLLIPVHGVHGEIETYLSRPDDPRVSKGRPLKYEIPAGSRMVVDVPPRCREQISDPAVPLFVTEGARKADAAATKELCCVSLIGVWCWRGTNKHGGKTLLPDFESIAFNGRDVYVVFDSDVMIKESVHAALERLVPVLERRGARVRVIYLPSGDGGSKVGLDDYFSAGHTVDELLALSAKELRALPGAGDGPPEYEATETGMVWNRRGDSGIRQIPLTNFSATVVADVVRDDGAERERFFELETELHGRRARFLVPAREFDSLGWVNEQVGAGAVVGPGYPTKEHARVAIRLLSGDPPRREAFGHLGWRKVDGQWLYLHAGGAIGADGGVDGVEVEVHDSLAHFVLPEPPGGTELVTAVRASLSMLEAAPPWVVYPLMASTFRVPLGPCAHGIHLAGVTGSGKSVLAGLAQQHFGAQMDWEHLPASWTSTANSLEGLLFAAKDCLVVIDDLTLGATRRDLEQANRLAERVYRAQANQQGRGRMRADSTLRQTKYPRGLALGTSEDLPLGQSLRARVLIVEFAHDSLDWDKVTELQAHAAGGVFSRAMAGYVCWLAGRYDQISTNLKHEIAEYRKLAAKSEYHRRTSDMLASLAVGLVALVDFAHEIGAITSEQALALLAEGWKAFGSAARAQLPHQAEANLPARFLSLLGSAITSGRAHLAEASSGREPDFPERWGWTSVPAGTATTSWRAKGGRVGWTDGNNLYLDLELALGAANSVADDIGQHLGVTPLILAKQLHERGLLLSTDLKTRQTYKVRHSVGGKRHAVLHLALGALDPGATETKPPNPTSQPTTTRPEKPADDGTDGRIGQVAAEQSADQAADAHTPVLDPEKNNSP